MCKLSDLFSELARVRVRLETLTVERAHTQHARMRQLTRRVFVYMLTRRHAVRKSRRVLARV